MLAALTALVVFLAGVSVPVPVSMPPRVDHVEPMDITGVEEPTLEELLTAAEVRHGLPDGILHAVAWVESSMNPAVVGALGEVGLMQLHPRYHDTSGGVSGQIETAAAYLSGLIDRFGCVDLGLAAYNQGPARPRVGAYVRRVHLAWDKNR